MKKIYVKPVMWTVRIQQTAGILQNSTEEVKGNTGLEAGGEGTEIARSRSRSVWDDHEEADNDGQ